MKNRYEKRYKDTGTVFFLILCFVMVVATALVGALLTIRSISELRNVLWKHMESVATMAATLIDGDELRSFTQEDAPVLDEDTGKRLADGSERCGKIERVLLQVKNSQKDMYISYIYVTRYENGRQVFVVDPDPDTPAEYGEEVVYTPSQQVAWSGIAQVDDEPYSDEWGEYYTAWSPVMDSSGRVVGLVGVDFEAAQISDEINYSTTLIISCTAVLLAMSITFFVLYSANVRKRSRKLVDEVTELADNLETVFDEIEGTEESAGQKEREEDPSDRDYMKYIHEKTLAMTQRLREHTAYLEQQANVDFLTKTGNTRAYSTQKETLQTAIEKGTADFCVAVFDINGLKEVNDTYGHEYGDILIRTAADVLKRTFAGHAVYRIGGDEFCAILTETQANSVELLFALLDCETENANRTLPDPVRLSLSKGYALFDSEIDRSFRDTFARADHNMYLQKDEYYADRKKR